MNEITLTVIRGHHGIFDKYLRFRAYVSAIQRIGESHDALPVDARLEQPVTLDAAGIALPDMLGRMSKGLALACDAECQDQKLQLCVVKRPLRQVMAALADLLREHGS